MTAPRSQGAPRPVRLPLSDSASANPMEMPAPIEAARPTRNASHERPVANAAANSGASVETEPSISPAEPRLDHAAARTAGAAPRPLRGATFGRHVRCDQLLGGALVRRFRLGQVAEQLPDRRHRCVRAAARRRTAASPPPSVRACRAHRSIPSGRSCQTGRALDEATHVLPADQRDVLAEALRDRVRSGGGDVRPPRPPSRRKPSHSPDSRRAAPPRSRRRCGRPPLRCRWRVRKSPFRRVRRNCASASPPRAVPTLRRTMGAGHAAFKATPQ